MYVSSEGWLTDSDIQNTEEQEQGLWRAFTQQYLLTWTSKGFVGHVGAHQEDGTLMLPSFLSGSVANASFFFRSGPRFCES